MKAFIIGSNGQLGREMQRVLLQKDVPFEALDYPDVDIADISVLDRLISEIKPNVVVNCAAYTNVDQAENDYDNAYRINAIGPGLLAQRCAEGNIELVHVSTDYVFDGEPILSDGHPRPYYEDDVCDPVTAYGKTKLEGERLVAQHGNKHYILRTAWLYGDGNNFVKTMLKLAETQKQLRVVDDQVGSPTSTVDLANAICTLMGSGAYGLYHASCEGQCSWYDFAKQIFALAGKEVEVVPVTSEEFIRPAKRPKWSVLENARLKHIGRNTFRQWDAALASYISEMKG